MTEKAVRQIVQQYFPPELQQNMLQQTQRLGAVQEIRCRIGQPLLLRLQQGREVEAAACVSAAQMQHIFSRISQGSAYAWEEELRQGYLTLPGGHRVGMVGKGVLEHGHIRTMKYISALNFRIARAVPGAADQLLELVKAEDGTIHNTLLVSPPGGGKTTLLRDLIRQVSDGVPRLGLSGMQVGLVDERSEVAGCVQGIPQLEVGCRTDVLDGCPKSEGIRMLIRSMAPQVVAADEIGTAADVQALEEALQSGVRIITTAHGRGWQELCNHPALGPLVQRGFFARIISLHWQAGTMILQCEGDRP